MKTTFRPSTFETNSSSVHAFVFVPDDILVAWDTPEHASDWLDFGKLLDEAGAQGAAYVDVPVTARPDCFVSESGMWKARNEAADYYLDTEEVIGAIEMIPLELVTTPEKYREWNRTFPQVQPAEGGVLVELDYEGWR